MRSKKQKLEGPEGEGSKSSKWPHLPQDISESILKLLSLRDYLQFGLVCTSWRTIVANALASKHCFPAPQLPELLILNRATDSDITDPCFFDLSKQKSINPKRQIFERSQYCYGSFEGWLFMVDNADFSIYEDWGISIHLPSSFEYELVINITIIIFIDPEVLLDESYGTLINPSNISLAQNLDHSSPFFLLNPISGDRILLPSQLTITPCLNPNEPSFTKIVASSSPNCQDCIIVGLVGTRCHLAVCKLVNKCWTLIEAEETVVFLDIEIIGKMLYVLVDDEGGESTISYDLEDANSPKLNMLASLEQPEQRLGITIGRDQGRTEYVTDRDFTYLARDNDSRELLMIRMLVDYAFNSDETTPSAMSCS
ncbi:hypothetical protein L6164_020725 [Bauhinia variegata]|uniref:Uncharacterized protein n=1 Tax=Bauhinia variegata TaxID=167791 RepID=A0ACB9MXL2_BAUVA|nr:hypothetical protein L6164_020725 [Bauhinia variegata]